MAWQPSFPGATCELALIWTILRHKNPIGWNVLRLSPRVGIRYARRAAPARRDPDDAQMDRRRITHGQLDLPVGQPLEDDK